MKNRLLSTLVILIALLSACSPRAATLPDPVATSLPNTPVELPTATRAPVVNTPAIVPETNTPASTATAEINFEPDEQCISLEQKLPNELTFSGAWVINQGNPYLENLANHKDSTVPLLGGGGLDTYDGDFAISPDGTHLAYIDKYYGTVSHGVQKRILRVFNSSGQALDMSFWKEEWQWIIGWVDNHNLAVATSASEVVVLNPATGGMRTFVQPVLVWDKIMQSKNNYYSPNIPASSYSPNLEWFVDHSDGWDIMDMKNVRTGETVLHTKDVDTIAWSADSTTLAVISGNLILILKGGKQEASFHISGLNLDYYDQPKLSLDNQKLAFNNAGTITVLDIAQNKLARLCDARYEPGYGSPIWSPDGRYVVEEVHDASYQSYDLLVDTQEMRAYLLNSGDYQHRFAWLAEPILMP